MAVHTKTCSDLFWQSCIVQVVCQYVTASPIQAERPDVQLSARRRTGLPDHHVSASFGEPRPSLSALSRCHDLVVCATRTVCFSPRSFAAVGPSTWNTLPVGLRNQQLSAVSFRHHVKTVLFRRAYTIFHQHTRDYLEL